MLPDSTVGTTLGVRFSFLVKNNQDLTWLLQLLSLLLQLYSL